MQVNIHAILKNLKQVTMSPSSVEILCEFERVIDENGLYAFLNWKEGELVAGPTVTPYRVECQFCWPLDKMPDPAGIERLLPYDIKATYRKAWFTYPVTVKSEEDFRPGSKKPKLVKTKVWIVTINIPKYLMKDIKQGADEIMKRQLSFDDMSSNYKSSITDQDSTESDLEDTPLGY